MAHLQFHSYGGDDWHTIRSEAKTIAEYFNAHKHLTADAGAVLFGNAVTITADGPWQHLLYQLTGRKWGNLDVENETGCGIVPYTYQGQQPRQRRAMGGRTGTAAPDRRSVADFPDDRPSQRRLLLALSRDHPSVDERGFSSRASQGVAARSAQANRSRRTRSRVHAIRNRHHHLRRAGTSFGTAQKGHLGVGADADVTIYNDTKDSGKMFGYPRYVIKDGEVVVEEGEIRLWKEGREFLVHPAYDATIEDFLRPLFQQVYTMSFENYPVEMERIHHAEIHPCQEADPPR